MFFLHLVACKPLALVFVYVQGVLLAVVRVIPRHVNKRPGGSALNSYMTVSLLINWTPRDVLPPHYHFPLVA